VIGASGAGKTAAVRAIDARRIRFVRCHYFDSIGVPTPEVMEREWGGGERWQEEMTKQWIDRLAANADGAALAVLDGQTRPTFIQPYLAQVGVRHARILLLDCAASVRNARLREFRGQPELVTERMDAWAAYLRGQAEALGLRIIDTSRLSVERVADILEEEIAALLRANAADA
jgi:hypothetical protein